MHQSGGEPSLNEAAELLASTSFPFIITGEGVIMGDAIEECKALEERLRAPVVNSYIHNWPPDKPWLLVLMSKLMLLFGICLALIVAQVI